MGDRFDFAEADGFAFGKDVALTDARLRKEQREFAKLCTRLRKLRWREDNRERVRAYERAYYAAHADTINARKRELRAQREKPQVIERWACATCGKRCERVKQPGRPPKFCGNRCRELDVARRKRKRKCKAVELTCNRCGVVFEPGERGVLPKFCGRSCYEKQRRRNG